MKWLDAIRSRSRKATQDAPVWTLIVAIFGLLCFVLAIGMYAHRFGNIEANQELWGQFGDYMGGVLNPFFSLLGFMALLYTIRLQLSGLKLASDESKVNMDSLAVQMGKADVTQFQNNFFQLLELHNNIVTSLSIGTGLGKEEIGRNAFKLLVARLDNFHRERANTIDELMNEYERLYIINQDLLGHYFRNLYYIVSFINNQRNVDRNFYMGLLRAQLSSSESVLLFYNCLTAWGKEKFKPLVEQYGLLKTLPVDREMPAALRDRYDWTAFSDGYSEK